MGRTKRYLRKAALTLKNEGPSELVRKSILKLQKEQTKMTNNPAKKIKFVSLVKKEDVMNADWSKIKTKKQTKRNKKTKNITWLMSPPGGGGGHQNIFRFINYLDKNGFKNTVYIYSTIDDMTVSQAKDNVSNYCSAKNLIIKRFKGDIVDSDILFATGWETAYPVFNINTNATKMYFVQDYEPLFYPMGTNYILAANTYKFGFHGVTAGKWLHNKLSKEYGMKCDYYDFGADPDNYKLTNLAHRKEIFFYARPVTERRGFDLGIMALEIFHRKHPEYIINLAGWDVSMYDIPFPYINHGALQINDLHKIYNKCAASLVISLTNMSLLPLELLSCGTIPVVNEGDNNRMVSDNPYIHYTEASPISLAGELSNVVAMKNLPVYAKKASESVKSASWDEAGAKFVKIIEDIIYNG